MPFSVGKVKEASCGGTGNAILTGEPLGYFFRLNQNKIEVNNIVSCNLLVWTVLAEVDWERKTTFHKMDFLLVVQSIFAKYHACWLR